jgi:signal transduction histidine kinase
MMETADPTIIFLALVGVLYLFIVGVMLKGLKGRGFQRKAVGLLFFYVVISLLWTLGQTVPRLGWLVFLADDVLARVLLYGLLFLSLLFFHLSRSFLRLEGTDRGWWALGVAWIAAVVILSENLLALPEVLQVGNGRFIQHREVSFGALVSGWGIFMGGATFLTARAYRRTQQPLHRNRITYWSLALGFTIVGAALFFAGREPLGSGPHLLGALIAAYAMMTYSLPDVRQMARRTASYLVITLLSVVMYTAGFLLAQYLFQSVPGYSPLLAGATMALVLAILFDPLLGLVQRLVNRLISRTRYDPGHTLREYSMSISNILDLKRLAIVAVGLIGEAMRIRRGALFVVHYEGGQNGGEDGNGCFRLRGVVGMGEEMPPGVLSFESPVADYLRLKQRPLTQYDIDLLPCFQEISPAERAWLDSLDMDVYVPIYTKGEWIGLLALGPKVSGDRYFDDDLILLSTLADQTAVALENARLFDDLKIRSAEIERLNKELTAANRELARLDKAKSDFIDIASHELRTPLTQVYGYSEILGAMVEEGSLTPEAGLQLTQGVGTAVQRLEEIVDIMFDVSQIDTDTLVLAPSLVSVASIVNMAVDVWATALEERNQRLTVEGLEGLPPIIADGGRLKQVFSHLIQNAIKYTPDGGQIRITGHLLDERTSPRDQSVEVVVADTGIGIPADDLDRIFEKFYRVGDVLSHSTGKTKFQGAGPGLGLAVARGIVEAHGGRIWAESRGCEKGIYLGSEFHVVLLVQPRCLESAGLETFIAAVRADVAQV